MLHVNKIENSKNSKYSFTKNNQMITFRRNNVQNDKDTFEKQNNNEKEKNIYKQAGFLLMASALTFGVYRILKGKPVVQSQVLESVSYIDNLSKDMSMALGKTIKPEQLKSVMSKEELLEVLPKFTKENYFAYKQDILPDGQVTKLFSDNVKNGIFKIDLHSHTNYSDGQADVQELLDNVVQYADNLYKKTNEKFIFSITDHDGIEGTKKALEIIAENPQKFENLRFVPGVELTYLHKGKDNSLQVSELLVHGINPFSNELNDFVTKIPLARKNLFVNLLDELNKKIPDVKFDINEMHGDFFNIKDDHDWFKYNIHWVVYNYVQIKQRLSRLAKHWGKNPESIYTEIMPQWHIFANQKSPKTFEEFLNSRTVDLKDTLQIDENIKNISFNYFPKIENNSLKATSERTFEDIINHFKNDNNVVIGFAHPAFTAQKLDNPERFFEELIKKSNGLIKTTERNHMSYFLPIKNNAITQKEIDDTNTILDKFNLYNIGGHDNHNKKLLEQI